MVEIAFESPGSFLSGSEVKELAGEKRGSLARGVPAGKSDLVQVFELAVSQLNGVDNSSLVKLVRLR